MNCVYLCACLGVGVRAFRDFLRSMLGHLKVGPFSVSSPRLLPLSVSRFLGLRRDHLQWGQGHPSLQPCPSLAASTLGTALPHPGHRMG